MELKTTEIIPVKKVTGLIQRFEEEGGMPEDEVSMLGLFNQPCTYLHYNLVYLTSPHEREANSMISTGGASRVLGSAGAIS